MSRDRPNKIKLPHRPGYTTYLQTGDLTSTDGEEGVYSLKLITGYTREEPEILDDVLDPSGGSSSSQRSNDPLLPASTFKLSCVDCKKQYNVSKSMKSQARKRKIRQDMEAEDDMLDGTGLHRMALVNVNTTMPQEAKALEELSKKLVISATLTGYDSVPINTPSKSPQVLYFQVKTHAEFDLVQEKMDKNFISQLEIESLVKSNEPFLFPYGRRRHVFTSILLATYLSLCSDEANNIDDWKDLLRNNAIIKKAVEHSDTMQKMKKYLSVDGRTMLNFYKETL